MTVAEAIRAATDRLTATSDTARLDAELLMAHALEVSRSDMLIRSMRDEVPGGFEVLIDRRANTEPVAYIIGVTEFYGRRFSVKPGVLIPRSDSETLVDAALELCPDPRSVLDLGTGSGCLMLTILAQRPAAFGIGVDASPVAIDVAGENAINLELESDCDFRLLDWHSQGWSDGLGTFDLILCNPPYVETGAMLDRDIRDYEPPSALFAGEEGLDDYRTLIPQLSMLMNENAVAVFEIGYQQADAVSKIAEDVGFTAELRHDLANRPRALIFRA